jgi:SAM-dependent methyltransferase
MPRGALEPASPHELVTTAVKSLPPTLTLEPGGHARVTPPQRLPLPLPRPSEPPPPAHVIVQGDTPPSQSKPTPAPAINVMRIIAVGTPKLPAEVAGAELLEEPPSDVEHDEETPTLSRTAPLDAGAEPAVEPAEIDDADVAPDSGEDKRPSGEVLELDRDDALSVPPDEPSDSGPEASAGAATAEAPAGDFPVAEPRSGEFPTGESPSGDVKPPPPPLRKPQPPRRGDSSRPRPRRALKRPWWEDIFGEDFTRAVPRLSEKQVAREVDFIEESLGVAKGGVVLDLGCGAGHHAVDLAGRGYGVVGYDLSVYQLALAADVAQERDQKINFLHGDMREMAFEAMFDGIYCWNTTFGYFEEDKNLAVAERVFRALKPGGMFLIDVANRDFAATYSPSQLWYEGDSCVCMDDMSVDFITSRLRVKRSVIFDDGRSRECTYSIRLYSLHELGKLLHQVGFRVAEASGHPSTPGVYFGEVSPRLIVLAQKP